MITRVQKFLVGFALFAAILIAGILFFAKVVYQEDGRFPSDFLIADRLPTTLEGWESAKMPLAESEELRRATENILNFTDAYMYQFSKGDTQFSVYVAYWEPMKMPVRMVQAHTPDICWVRNGWTMIDEESEFDVKWQAGGYQLFPAEKRTLEIHDQRMNTAYWHIVGDKRYVNRAGREGQWDRWGPLKSLFSFGLKQRQEQFFVRIASNQPLDDLMQDPDVQKMMAELAKLTLSPEIVEKQFEKADTVQS